MATPEKPQVLCRPFYVKSNKFYDNLVRIGLEFVCATYFLETLMTNILYYSGIYNDRCPKYQVECGDDTSSKQTQEALAAYSVASA